MRPLIIPILLALVALKTQRLKIVFVAGTTFGDGDNVINIKHDTWIF